MKLVEILARELKEWPEGCHDAMRSYEDDSKMVFFYGCGEGYDRDFSTRSSDAGDRAIVTRAKWEAERERITETRCTECESGIVTCTEGNEWPCYNGCKGFEAGESRIKTNSEEEQELAAIACGKRSKEDRALWDKAALSAMQSLMTVYWEAQDKYEDAHSLVKCQVESSFEYADAFMAERAKRLEDSHTTSSTT